MDLVQLKKHSLTPAQFERLADVPPEEEWLANITNLKTRRAYKEDVREFIAFTALQDYKYLEDPLAEEFLRGNLKQGDTLEVHAAGEQLAVKATVAGAK